MQAATISFTRKGTAGSTASAPGEFVTNEQSVGLIDIGTEKNLSKFFTILSKNGKVEE